MSLVDNLALGFSVSLGAVNLLYCFVGVTIGTLVGVLPGIGPLVAIAVLLPLTFGLPPEGSLIMLAGIYYGASYGGSTTAILLNLPGETSSVVTCIDGYQMSRQGRAGPALAIAAIGSFVAGCFGTVLIAILAPLLVEFALEFRSPEYFSLMLMALVCSAALVHGSLLKGLLMALLGVLLALVGIDTNSGEWRFTFGLSGLADGIDFGVVALGLFALPEIIRTLETREFNIVPFSARIKDLMPTLADVAQSWKPILRGTVVGSFFGVLPGTGPAISSFSAYMLERKLSRDPSRFGHGAIEGVAAPEAANNAAAQTGFVPTLALGVPGSATMALFLGALMLHGIAPGPEVMIHQPALFWGLIASMWIGNLMLLIVNLPLIGLWVRLLQIPYRWLFPAILAFACVGVFSVSASSLDVVFCAIFGLLGYVFLKLDCEPAPLILGFVLGPLVEENFRRSMLLARGDPSIFIERPISLAFLLVSLGVLVTMILPLLRQTKVKEYLEC